MCTAHGLRYDPSASQGCVLCRKYSVAPAESASATRRWLVAVAGGATVLLALALLLVRRQRAPDASLSQETEASASRQPSSRPGPGAFGGASTGAQAPVVPTSAPALQAFGVPSELVPRFYQAELAMAPDMPAPVSEDSLGALSARIGAERASCEGGSTEACVQELKDCSAAASHDQRPGSARPTAAAQMMLGQALRGPNGPAIRAALANGGAGLPPSYVEAAKALGIGHEQELIAVRRELAEKCRDDYARSELPAACNDGSLVACELLICDPNQKAAFPRACDVGSRNACIQLSQSLGLTTLAGEAARLRAIDLGRCAAPDAGCTARSREELAATAPNTLRAGIRQVCTQPGVAECKRLAQQFEQEHSDAALIAEVRSQACELGDSDSCSIMMWLYADGRGVPRDEQKALALYERSQAGVEQQLQALQVCDAGTCGMLQALARRSASTLPVRDQMTRAQLAPDLTSQRCNGGDLDACLGLRNAFRVGRHPDPARAATFSRKAAVLLDTECQAGKPEACDALAGILVELDGSDHARGLALLHQGCSAGRPDACFELARKAAAREQKQGALQRKTAIQETRCNAGNLQDCIDVEYAYETGRGVARDPVKEREYTAKRNKLLGFDSSSLR